MKVISLFSGCGGLDWGFEKAGFEVVWANEFDKTIHETYRQNHPNTELNTQDIRKIKDSDVPDCDGIIGGPPCQSWSLGGMCKGIEESRRSESAKDIDEVMLLYHGECSRDGFIKTH